MGKKTNGQNVLYCDLFERVSFDNASMVIGLNVTKAKECFTRVERLGFVGRRVTTCLENDCGGG